MRILVTGGPVPANLDAVKLITNRFKGGTMAAICAGLRRLDPQSKVDYLTFDGAPTREMGESLAAAGVPILTHSGFEDYRERVRALAESGHYNAIVLGAAVANLIPVSPWKGKFPSHDYKPGAVINIPFTIASRIIDEVKQVAPNVALFGFKLLSGVEPQELVDAAYGVLLESKAIAVFANDGRDIKSKWMVTREYGAVPMGLDDVPGWILALTEHKWFSSEVLPGQPPSPEGLAKSLDALFKIQPEPARYRDLTFGTVAVRVPAPPGSSKPWAMLTTARGKSEFAEAALVVDVDLPSRQVVSVGRKATLNAPLLWRLLEKFPNVEYIIHGHGDWPGLQQQGYAPAGTVLDTERCHWVQRSFHVEGHGFFGLIDKEDHWLV